MSLVVGRLNDKSSIVRKNALQLVTALLKSNPFAARVRTLVMIVNTFMNGKSSSTLLSKG